MKPSTFVAVLVAGMVAGGAADALNGYLTKSEPMAALDGTGASSSAGETPERSAALDAVELK